MAESILGRLLIVAGPAQGYLVLIETCKISNRIDSWKWKSSVNISLKGRRWRRLSYSVFADVVGGRGGCKRISGGDFYLHYFADKCGFVQQNLQLFLLFALNSVEGKIIVVCFLFKLFSIRYTRFPLAVSVCIVLTDMLVPVLCRIRPCCCLIIFQGLDVSNVLTKCRFPFDSQRIASLFKIQTQHNINFRCYSSQWRRAHAS